MQQANPGTEFLSGSVPALAMLRRAAHGREPRLPPLHPDLRLRREVERGVVERAEANLHGVLVQVRDPRPAARAEAPAVVRRELAGQLECRCRPLRVDAEGAARLLAAVGAVAAADVARLASDAVPNGPAQA